MRSRQGSEKRRPSSTVSRRAQDDQVRGARMRRAVATACLGPGGGALSSEQERRGDAGKGMGDARGRGAGEGNKSSQGEGLQPRTRKNWP